MGLKLSLVYAIQKGCDWTVLRDAENYLIETPGANIFFIKDGTLYSR